MINTSKSGRDRPIFKKISYIFCRTSTWGWCWPCCPWPSSGSIELRSRLARPEGHCSKGWGQCTSSRTEGWTSGLLTRCRSSNYQDSLLGPDTPQSAHLDIQKCLQPNLSQENKSVLKSNKVDYELILRSHSAYKLKLKGNILARNILLSGS